MLKKCASLSLLATMLIINTPGFSKEKDTLAHRQILNHIVLSKEVMAKTKVLSLESAMHTLKVPAISFALIEKNKITWVDAIGCRSTNCKHKVNANTLFQAGSMSKTVAAIAALKAVDQKKLDLNRSVNLSLIGWKIQKLKKYKDQPVTLNQLLSMSSGLDVGGYYGYAPGSELPTVIQTLSGSPPANNPSVKMILKPGSQYYYSGGGYEVLELLMNSVLHDTFTVMVNKLLFKPLGMEHSTYTYPLPFNLSKNIAFATGNDGKSFKFPYRVAPEYAAAGLWTTPHDLATLLVTIMASYNKNKKGILSLALAKKAIHHQENTPYGLGFAVKGSGKTLRFMKLGQNVGYQGWLVGFPNTGQGVVVMTNSDNGRELSQSLIRSIAKVYHWPTNGQLQDAWMLQ